MADSFVRGLGHVEDIDEMRATVGVDFDAVVVAGHRMNRVQCEEFGRLFIAACWEAADNARLMAEDVAG